MKNFIKKNKFNWVLTIFLLIGSAFSVVTVVSAVAPNPGHTWAEVGDVLVNLATQVTGTLGTAHLGAGTADTTTFLRGDGSWATPAGGAGGTYTPLLIGGTAVDSNIIYKSTTGAGTVSGIAHKFTGGNNGATVAMTLLNNGNVGIGTTSPIANLQVEQTTAGVGTVTTNGTTSVIGVGTQFLKKFKVGDTIKVSGETRTIASIASDTSLTTDTWTGSFANFAYTLAGGPRFSVLGNGNVGIGTLSPTIKLAVGDSDTGLNSAGDGLLDMYSNNVNTMSIRDGKVGIGTIGPSGLLSVTSTRYSTGTASQSLTTVTGVGTTFTSGMVGLQLVYANSVSAGTITGFTDATTLTVSTSKTVASQAYKIAYTGLQVSTAGNVGIGTTGILNNKLLTVSNMVSPYSKAQATGIAVSLSGGGGIYMNGGGLGGVDGKYEVWNNALGVGTMSSHPLEFFTNDTEKMRINTNGNVGIGTNNPLANLQVVQTPVGAGTVTTNGTTSVIGVGTLFSNTFKVGDTITVSGETRTIAYIGSNTSLTTDTWTGSFADSAYTLAGGPRFSVFGNGNVGIGTTNPVNSLHLSGTQLTDARLNAIVGPMYIYNTTNNFDTPSAQTIFTMARAGKTNSTWGNAANFNLSRYSQSGQNANTQVDLRVSNGARNDPDVTVMSWLGNGNVGIGTTTPNANAILDVTSTTKAFMPPRMTTTQKAAIASPTAGMVVYDATLNKLSVYTGAAWETITSL